MQQTVSRHKTAPWLKPTCLEELTQLRGQKTCATWGTFIRVRRKIPILVRSQEFITAEFAHMGRKGDSA